MSTSWRTRLQRHLRTRMPLSATCLALSLIWSGADNWAQFGDPDANYVSAERGLLKSWPEEGPKVLWTVKTGPGYGGAIVQGGNVKWQTDKDPGFDWGGYVLADDMLYLVDGKLLIRDQTQMKCVDVRGK